jgi:predicted glutamine amidotransferase
MCRLLGIFSKEAVTYRNFLSDVPSSLKMLSREHPHGWGLAVFGQHGWHIEKAAACADTDARFDDLASVLSGTSMIGHIRQRTVGPLCVNNTHPFVRDGWLFCHNGTIKDLDWLRSQCSPRRLSECIGDTDSEILFSYLLTRLEGQLAAPDVRFEQTLLRACLDMTDRGEAFGACNFLLSNGDTCFAHRFGRTLFVLEGDAIVVASEKMLDANWRTVEEKTLLRVDRAPVPVLRQI